MPLYVQLSLAALVTICGLAIWKGGPPERSGGLLIVLAWLVTVAADLIVGRHHLAPLAFLASDALLAAGLLILAVRFSSWWMGAAMLLQAASLSFHSAYFAADKSELSHELLNLYVLGKNLSSILVLAVLLAATIVGMVKRARKRAADRLMVQPGLVEG